MTAHRLRLIRALTALATVLAVTAGAGAVAEPAHAGPRGFLTGFTDFDAYQHNAGGERALALQHTRDARGSVVRLFVSWVDVAKAQPPNDAAARDPGWPGYDWSQVDSWVRDASGAGLQVLFNAGSAPAWAEGPGRPPVSDAAPAGTWRPSPQAFQAFAVAAARRYSGGFPDPSALGRSLPHVRYWQGWNEPNLTNFLTPQWEKRQGRYTAVSPDIYRALLNGWYRGIKAASRTNVVVTAGTAPFGDPNPGGRRIPPARFVRELFCLGGTSKLRAHRCPDSPVRFDVLAHHPYPIGPPRRHAANRDDVVVPDFAKLTRPLSAALRAHKVGPRGRKPVWATEISWDSRPPDPNGIPAQLHARYLEGAFSTLYSQGVDAVIWFMLRDDPSYGDYSKTLQSGIFERGATVAQDPKKPAFEAFRFPFTAYIKRGVAELWGLAPDPGPVTIEVRRGGSWQRLTRLRAGRSRVFLGHARVRPGTELRARRGLESSLSWRAFAPR